jgi:hypothetical protein
MNGQDQEDRTLTITECLNKLQDFRRCRVAQLLVFRLVLVDNCSVLCPIFHFYQRIGYPQFKQVNITLSAFNEFWDTFHQIRSNQKYLKGK